MEFPESFGGLLGLEKFLAMFLLPSSTVRANTFGMFSTFTDDVGSERADVVVKAAGWVRLKLGIDCLVSDLKGENYLPQLPLRRERVQLGAIF